MRDLPKSWEWAELDDLVAAIDRPITDGPFGSNLKTVHYTDHGPRVIRLQNIGDGKFLDEKAHIAQEHFETLRAHAVEAGDLVVASLGADLPRACLVPDHLGSAIVKADCIRVRLHSEIDATFVNFALQRPALRKATEKQIHGVGRPRIGMKGVRALSVPVPPLAEQRRIVAAIEEHFSRLDAAEAGLGTALRREKALSSAIFSAANDASWPEVPLGELLDDIEAGKSFKTPGRPAEADEWGVIKVSAMTWGEFDETQNKAVLDVGRVEARYQIKSGDLLLSRANTSELVGASVLVGDCRDRLLLSDKSMRLVTKPDVDRRWLRYCLGSPALRAQMSAVATGTSDSMRNISQSKVRALRVRTPSPSIQREVGNEIAERLTTATRLVHELEVAARRSRVLRSTILTAAFSGQLVPQDSSDEPASVLLERIATERAAKPSRRKVAAS